LQDAGKGGIYISPKEIYYENIAATIIKNLEKRQMEGYYCKDRQAAAAKALELMEEGSSVAWGGSMTLRECGLLDAVKQGNYKVIDRDEPGTEEEIRRRYGDICCSDYFLTSTNAITESGELVNIDCRGNRVAFMMFGPRNVIVITGLNKVVKDADSAVKRIKTQASPPNTVRLGRTTPCAVTGVCADCHSPGCICCHTVITRHSPYPNRIKVILVGEELGY